jgi:hypothetical protein
MFKLRRPISSFAILLSGLGVGLALPVVATRISPAIAQTARQPKVAPGPNEPDWNVVLRKRYGLSMFGDLLNPVKTTPEATPGRFKMVGPGPVWFTPVIALGLETVNRGGWYLPGADPRTPDKRELWSYKFKNTTADLENNTNLPPPLNSGAITRFDPGDQLFGLWVSNEGLDDGGVFSEPKAVAAVNGRLARQPYKTMIYPNRDAVTGTLIPNSYIIGWEYSTNDDFQDVVTQVDHVELVD